MSANGTSEFIGGMRGALELLEKHAKHPYGLEADGQTRKVAGNACVELLKGDNDRARALWKQITEDFGYMPYAAAVALIRAQTAGALTPDVEAPEIS
jgi:hypothetical protein